MNTTFKKTILATAIAAFCAAPAFAGERGGDHHDNGGVKFDKEISLETDIEISGDPQVVGLIPVSAAGVSVIESKQAITAEQGSNSLLTNNASLSDNAAQGASGNIGINTAAGDNNAQSNSAALSAADAMFVFGTEIGAIADAEVFATQAVMGNHTMNSGVINNASLSGEALQGAAGNIGVNIASGNNNAQQNNLAASVASKSSMAQATASTNQASMGNSTTNAGYVQQYTETTQVSLTGSVDGVYYGGGVGGYSGTSVGSYHGHESGSYAGVTGGLVGGTTASTSTGTADQIGNVYPDIWTGNSHPAGYQTGHFDLDTQTQGGSDLNGDGGALAFNTKSTSEGTFEGGYVGGEAGGYMGHESGKTYSKEKGSLGFVEMGATDAYASLSGSVATTRYVVVNAENNASLSGNTLQNASGNIGVNVAAGTGNMQANSLSMAVTQAAAAPAPGGEQ